MSFIIQAPYPLMQTTLLLRSPVTSNTQQLRSTVQTMRSMSGKLYTYVKEKRGRKSYAWDFVSTKDKAREVKSFIDKYARGLVRATDHNGDIIIGYITLNPVEAQGEGRAGGWPSEEAYRFSLTMETLV